MVHQHLLNSEIRTRDPARAQLFFVPAYLGRYFNAYWQQWSTPGDAWDITKDCRPEHTDDECWWEKWTSAKLVCSDALALLAQKCVHCLLKSSEDFNVADADNPNLVRSDRRHLMA